MSASKLNRLFRLSDLPQFVGLRRTQILELMRLGKFPKAIKISDGGRAIAWLESDLIEWQSKRVERRNSTAA